MTRVATGMTHCANCGAALHGSYCGACGQKATALNPTTHDFLHDLTHELLHVDGKIFKSVRLLLTKPGFLTREHFEGRRARYISPIRLYLVFSVLFFGVSAATTRPLDEKDRAELREASTSIGALANADPVQVYERVNAWAPRAMFLLLPVFALLVSALTRSAGRNYPQDLYFALHVHAAVFAAGAVAVLARSSTGNDAIESIVDIIGLAFVWWYLIVAFRTAYAGNWPRAVARASLGGVAYLVLIVAAATGGVLAALVL
jgi:hypothetical protein